MTCLTRKSQSLERLGPTIDVVITPSTAFLKSVEKESTEKLGEYKKGIQVTMLIDTGASVSAIDATIAKSLNLKSHGTTTISTPSSNSYDASTYDIDFLIPTHNVHMPNMKVISSDFSSQNIDGLIGRDVLKNVLLVYHGYSNEFTLAI